MVVLIGAGVAAFILLQPKTPAVQSVEQSVLQNSSLVSEGVDKNDLGNIMNGQFFFDDGTSQYYSSFDSSNMPHIYKMDKASNTSKSIFNGFGWSFVVYKEWLYFSGNQGTAIDGTYNLYRISLDGVKVEKLRDIYCYGLTFNKEWLYYIKQENSASKNYYIARCGLDGTKEEVLVKDGNGYCIIYQDKLYYTGQDGYLYSTNPDGTAKTKVGLEKMFSFIIGGGKLIFIDINKNIRTSDIDGQNVKLIKAAMTPTISKINSYKDTIFYANYDSKRLAHRNAWTYYVYSIKMDGSADTKIREGVSTNAYINVLNDKLYVMDYSSATAKGTMTAIVKSMGLDGTNPVEIFR